MSKNDVVEKLKLIKGNYNLIFYSKAAVNNSYIILAKGQELYSIFKFDKENLFIIEYDLKENDAIKKYASLI